MGNGGIPLGSAHLHRYPTETVDPLAMQTRFSIRTVFIAICVAALVFSIGPNLYRRAKFVDHYKRLRKLSAEFERRPGRAEGYEFQAANGVWLSVWTCEHTFADKYSLAVYDGAPPDPNRFFVVPPGKWVDTIDDVLATWDAFD